MMSIPLVEAVIAKSGLPRVFLTFSDCPVGRGVEHPSTRTAASTGLAWQTHDFGPGVELEVRLGIHTGEPTVTREYVGPDGVVSVIEIRKCFGRGSLP